MLRDVTDQRPVPPNRRSLVRTSRLESHQQERPLILLALALLEQTMTVIHPTDIKYLGDSPPNAIDRPTKDPTQNTNRRSRRVLSQPAWVPLRMLSAFMRWGFNVRVHQGSHTRTTITKKNSIQSLGGQHLCIPYWESTLKWCVTRSAHRLIIPEDKLSPFIFGLLWYFICLPSVPARIKSQTQYTLHYM